MELPGYQELKGPDSFGKRDERQQAVEDAVRSRLPELLLPARPHLQMSGNKNMKVRASKDAGSWWKGGEDGRKRRRGGLCGLGSRTAGRLLQWKLLSWKGKHGAQITIIINNKLWKSF